MPSVALSPAALAQVNTKLAAGPSPDLDTVDVTADGCHVTIWWRELPKRLAAVIALIGGVLFLIVSPTAPDAAAHARELMRTHTVGTVIAEANGPVSQVPVQPLRPRRGKPVTPPEETRRRATDAGTPIVL